MGGKGSGSQTDIDSTVATDERHHVGEGVFSKDGDVFHNDIDSFEAKGQMDPDDKLFRPVVGFEDDVEVLQFEQMNSDAMEEEEAMKKRQSAKYPADCYSFLALHDPFSNLSFFFFGLTVWLFQMSFFLLMVLRVASQYSTNEDTDNPWRDSFFHFIPANVNSLSRITQFLALTSYCFFADDSLKDIVKAVELFPRFDKATTNDKFLCMVFSCILRFAQGMMATMVVLLLVIQTSDVIEIILNFAAVNFISGFDDLAFELAQWGKYGPKFKAEADRIEDLILPDCVFRKYDHVRYRYTISLIGTILIILLSAVGMAQNSSNVWLTKTLRVQFKDGSLFEDYSGCYKLDPASASWLNPRKSYFKANGGNAKIGYCDKDRKWILYKGTQKDACDAEEVEKITQSAKSYAYDIWSTFEEPWYSSSGRPLELYFFDNETTLTDDQCSSFLGDGICNDFFNKAEYDYDEGDCCTATCDETTCGIGTLTSAFDTEIVSGNGYPACEDSSMEPITIRLNNVWTSQDRRISPNLLVTGEKQTREPLMILDCDGKNVLMVSIKEKMKNKTEEVKIADGASCVMMVNNSTLGDSGILFVDYTIFHGNEASINSDPIAIVHGDSSKEDVTYFQRIPQCFIGKLQNHVNSTTIYTGNDPSNQAVRWLMNDTRKFSNCNQDDFLERYALATINFAAPIISDDSTRDDLSTRVNDQSLWINSARHCVWRAVVCAGNIVTEISYEALSNSVRGTFATEIGLLKNLTRISMGGNLLGGNIPSEIGQLSALTRIFLDSNQLNGTIPTEFGLLSNLRMVQMNRNSLSGSIPSEIGQLTSLQNFLIFGNRLNSSIPSQIGDLTSLIGFYADANLLVGTIPSEIGKLPYLEFLGLSHNRLTGTIPKELGETGLQGLNLDRNALTGSVPSEVIDLKLGELAVYGNRLSNLTEIDGNVICSFVGYEHYCDCAIHCFDPLDDPTNRKCDCQEAEPCCSSFLENNADCVICENGFVDPSHYIFDEGITCEILRYDRKARFREFGTTETCNAQVAYAEEMGCVCKPDCQPCEYGVENQEYFVEEVQGTCGEVHDWILMDTNTLSECQERVSYWQDQGCRCMSAPDSIAECIICEFGLENPEFFLQEYQARCTEATEYIKVNINDFGSKSVCDNTRIGLVESGCTCNDGPEGSEAMTSSIET